MTDKQLLKRVKELMADLSTHDGTELRSLMDEMSSRGLTYKDLPA